MRRDSSTPDPTDMQMVAPPQLHWRLVKLARPLVQLVSALGFSVAGLWAAVDLTASPHEAAGRPAFVLRDPPEDMPEVPAFRQIEAMPDPSIIFLVSSRQAQREVEGALVLDALIRATTNQPPRDFSTAVVGSDAEAQAFLAAGAGGATVQGNLVTLVEVIDLR